MITIWYTVWLDANNLLYVSNCSWIKSTIIFFMIIHFFQIQNDCYDKCFFFPTLVFSPFLFASKLLHRRIYRNIFFSEPIHAINHSVNTCMYLHGLFSLKYFSFFVHYVIRKSIIDILILTNNNIVQYLKLRVICCYFFFFFVYKIYNSITSRY